MPPAAKKHPVLRGFNRLNDAGDGEDSYTAGDTCTWSYSKPVPDEYLHPQGPDGQGPLLGAPIEDSKPADKAPAGSDSKGAV
jgi:hypothetical protein